MIMPPKPILFPEDNSQPAVNAAATAASTVPTAATGVLWIRRASHVEPDGEGRWWADLAPVSGPTLGPFDHRSEALEVEFAWLTANRLAPPTR